jgi:hypothetical protein
MFFDEHGSGGDGEYYGDDYAQLGRINLIYQKCLGRQVRTTHGVLRPRALVIDAFRASRFG